MPFRALVRLPLGHLFQGLCEEHRAGAGGCSERCRADPRWRVLMTKTDGPISASGRGVGITLGEALQTRGRASSAEAQAEQPRIDALFTHHRFYACPEWLFGCWRQGISLHVGGCEEARNRPDAARNGRPQQAGQANVTALSMLGRRGTRLTTEQGRLGPGAAAGELTAQRAATWVQPTSNQAPKQRRTAWSNWGCRTQTGFAYDAPPMQHHFAPAVDRAYVSGNPATPMEGSVLSNIADQPESGGIAAAGGPKGGGSTPRAG